MTQPNRHSFCRFLGRDLEDKTPDAKTIWLFREQLTRHHSHNYYRFTLKIEARIARLESEAHYIQSDIAQIKTDVRELRSDNKILLGMIIAASLGLAGIMAKGFGWL